MSLLALQFTTTARNLLASDTIMRLSVVVGISYHLAAILVKVRIQDMLFSCSIFYFITGVCKDPGSLDNGNVIGNDYSYNSLIRFQCNLGYDLLGPASLTCNKGTWNGGIPACKSKYIKPFQLHLCTLLR